ncbi:ataxin-2-like protein isoform X2 [Acropora muricata]|uniref:ataxin-2-like protein isoform X2 n=1 Tax=Acropora muricata TaxID=159855 RepID=UPI0034E4C207
MSLMKHRRGGRGGNRGQRSHRAGSSPPPQSNSFVNIDDGVSNTNFRFNEAIVYHVTSNLGETARVVVRSGDIYEGILRAVSSKFDCVLGEAHLVPQKKPANGLIEDERILPNRERLINNILIALKDIVTINITKTEEPDSAIDRFTDEAIAGSRHANGQLAERQLQKWVPQEPEPILGGGLEDNTQMNGWAPDEMFKTNQKKFGVTSTYSDALEEYTMPIPDGTREMELRAEQTAREIEQSCGHSRRQEVDSGCTEEEAFASVIRPKTTAQASRPTNSPPVTAIAERQEVAADKSSPCATKEGSGTSTTATLSSTTENKVSPDEDASQGSFVKSPAMSETSKVVQDLKDFSANFKLQSPRRPKDIPTEPETGETGVAPSKETPSSEKGNVDDSKTSKPPEDDILTTSKLNPLAKEFKFTPKSQKPTPSPQPAQYVSMLPAQPFSPTSVRPPAVPYSQPVMMFNPQQLNPMYRGKPPHNKSRGQSYAVRDQESPPFISAAAATGSPIIAPGGTYPPQVYQLPPIAYVQSTGGMATQPMVQQYVTVPAGHPPARFIAPVSSPGSGPPVPMSQAYQEGSPMPVYAGNMSALPGAATSPGQPQPSPSQQGQFIFASPVPPLPGQPQGAGHHQAQVAPGPTQFPPQPVVYIPNANVSSSAASAVSYIPGTYPTDRIQ